MSDNNRMTEQIDKLTDEQREEITIQPLPKPDIVKVAKDWVTKNYKGTLTESVFDDLFEEIINLRSSEQAAREELERRNEEIKLWESKDKVQTQHIEMLSGEIEHLRRELNQAVEVSKNMKLKIHQAKRDDRISGGLETDLTEALESLIGSLSQEGENP